MNEYITRNSWSTHVDQWLDLRAALHARITDWISDATYTNQVEFYALILRCKTEHKIGMRAHKGSKTITYTHFETYL